MPRNTDLTLTPAGVLLAVRDGQGETFDTLCVRCGITLPANPKNSGFEYSGFQGFAERQRLKDILESLQAAGLIELSASGSYSATKQWYVFQESLQFSLHDLARRSAAAKADTYRELVTLLKQAEQASINPYYEKDFKHTLNEIRQAYASQCYITVIALCGKILEVCLKEMLNTKGAAFDNSWPIGKLLAAVRMSSPDHHIDPNLGSLYNIINNARVTAIHSDVRKEMPPTVTIPIPTRSQTDIVIHAVAEVASGFLSSLPRKDARDEE